MAPPRKPRTTYDASNQQVGEQENAAAGRDIRYGADPDKALDLLRYMWEVDQQRDILAAEIKEAGRVVQALSREFDIYQRFVSDRLAADATRRAADRLIAVVALLVGVAALGIALFL